MGGSENFGESGTKRKGRRLATVSYTSPTEVILQTQKTDFWGHNPQRMLFSICFLLPTPTDIKIRSVTGLERISRETSSNWSEKAKIGPKQFSMLFSCQNRSEVKVASADPYYAFLGLYLTFQANLADCMRYSLRNGGLPRRQIWIWRVFCIA